MIVPPKACLVYHPQIALNLNLLTLCAIRVCSGHAVHQFSKRRGAKLKGALVEDGGKYEYISIPS